MKLCRAALSLLSVCFLLAGVAARSQGVEPRLRGELRDGRRAVLAGSLSPRVAQARDLGAVPAGRAMHGMTLVFRRSAAQEAELQRLLTAQQDPKSAEFHHWLTPESFGQRFGVADEDLQTTKRWLAGQGFVVSGVSRARDRVHFSGTAKQAETAFRTRLRQYEIGGERHMAPAAAISLPEDLATMTAAVLHLSDFRPQPRSRVSPHPAYTAAGTQTHYLTPGDLAVEYDLPVPEAGFALGGKQSIAVVGQSYVDLSNQSAVRSFVTSATGLHLTPVLVPGTGVEAISPEDAFESEIDLEYIAGLLHEAEIFLVFTGSDPDFSVFDSLAFAIDTNLAPVVSISYGECETFLSQSELDQANALFEQATSQGQTLIAAAGDAGSTACAFYPTNAGFTAVQQQALAVDFPAVSPYVTAVGGTQLAAGTFGDGDTRYWAAAPSPYDAAPSLLSYVPEVAWNEDSAADGIFAGGGGASGLVPRPAWQTGFPGMPPGSTRLLPDLALEASGSSPGFLFCTDDQSYLPYAGRFPACGTGPSDAALYPRAGGTSFAAPTFAAMVALLNQSTQSLGQGNVNPTLYRLASDPAVAASAFHDITSGSIACMPGVPRCSAAGQSGYAATAGYDEATGLGSVDYLRLQAAWPGSSPQLEGTTVSLSGLITEAQPGGFEVLSVSVQSVSRAASPPSGSVTVFVDGVVLEAALPFSEVDPPFGASVAYSFSAPMTVGAHAVTVTYPGDSAHGPARATASILVGNVLATGAITLTATNVTLATNGAGTSTVTVTPTGGYNGQLFWSLGLSGGDGSALTACYSIPVLAVQGVSTTTLSLGSGTACSGALPQARGAMRAVTVGPRAKTVARTGWMTISATMATLVFLTLPGARSRRPAPLLCLLVLAASGALVGCGSGGGGSPGTGLLVPVKARQYTATLTGRDSVNGSIQSSTDFAFTVQ